MTWEEREDGFWIGMVDGKFICKISVHWTGCWLDGFDIPIVCQSINEAKKTAEDKVA